MSRSVWNHALCLGCFRLLVPGKEPVRFKSPNDPEPDCCHCSEPTNEGIWYRAEPDSMNCEGRGPVHESTD